MSNASDALVEPLERDVVVKADLDVSRFPVLDYGSLSLLWADIELFQDSDDKLLLSVEVFFIDTV